jgi:hypothetical protein
MMAKLQSLQELHLVRGFQKVPGGFYDALQHVRSLRSLTALRSSSYSTLPVAAIPQLQELYLPLPFLQRLYMHQVVPPVLGQLTGLTSLHLVPLFFTSAPPFWQEQLSSALRALTGLGCLSLPFWPGPVTAVLPRMTSVTQLQLSSQFKQPMEAPAGMQGMRGLHLPHVQLLKLGMATPGFLDYIIAPQLQVICGRVWHRASLVSTSVLHLTLEDAGSRDSGCEPLPAKMARFAQGILGCCNRLSIKGAQSTTATEATAVMKALGRWWRPGESLVDGSHPLSQLQESDKYSSSSSSPSAEVGAQAADGWHLELSHLPCSRAALAALPQGLTRLELRCVVELLPN